MTSIKGKQPFSTPKNINLKLGLLKFSKTQTSNLFGTEDYGMYVNSSGQLVWSNAGTATILSGTGAGTTVPSFDAVFQNDQNLDLVALSSFTIDRSSGNNDVLTLTNTGAGSGDTLQITNVGTGKDINGTGGTWSFSKAGDMTANMAVFAGDAGSDSITLTAGDVLISDGSVTITDADDAASFSLTNNTATSASVVVIAGSGVFTGNTTSSFMTLTASGLTTGTVLYIPVAGLTTGKGINLIGTTALTTGVMLNVESGTTGTSLTGNGRLLRVAHTGTATSTGILSEFLSAATDETVILKVTASAALALGTALAVSASSLTTGYGITVADLDALTTGAAVSIASASTSLTGTGRLLKVVHSGTSTAATTAKIVEFSTAATEDTELFKLTASAALAAGIVENISAALMTTGTALKIADLNALTSGIGVHIASSATAITGAGRLLYSNHTGATGTSAILNEFASAANDETTIVKITSSDVLAAGINLLVSTATTTGKGISVVANALTDGMGISIASSATATTSTGRLLSVVHSGVTSTNGILSEFSSAANDETILVKITASDVNALGKSLFVSTATTTGNGIQVTANALTDGFGLTVDSTSTGLTSTGRLFLINSAGATGTSGIVAEIKTAATDETIALQVLASAALAAGKIVNISGGSMTTGTALSIANLDALTTGVGVNVTSNSADATARSLVYIKNDHASATGVAPLTIVNDAVQGTGSKFKRAATFCGISIWVSIDGTSPNGALTGDAVGDICLNAATGKPLICTGTNVWAAVA